MGRRRVSSLNSLGDISWHDKTICHINAIVVVRLKQNSVTILPLFEEEKEEVAMKREVVNTLVDITQSLLNYIFRLEVIIKNG